METTSEQIKAWLSGCEDEHLEFKAAEESCSFDMAMKYCCAFANERGGCLILGVKDKPREIIGTRAADPGWQESLKLRALEEFRFRINIEERMISEHRIVIIHIPPRPIGQPLKYSDVYWMRSGGSLVSMTADHFQRIFAESQLDFSAEVCPNATLESLNKQAIDRLRTRWHRKSGNDALLQFSEEQLLADAELVLAGKITYAALVLLGSHGALGRFLGQSEIIFEYRANEASTPYQERREYREGFFCFDDELWQRLNLRNEIQHFQDGLFIWDIPTFNERVVREALLNAVSHRDYRLAPSIMVKQSPARLEIISPGGFPKDINAQNILWKQNPRNRRIAEVLAKCGLVERSGQGARIMFAESIKEGKAIPDFAGTDEHQVSLTLHGRIQDVRFLKFLERIGQATLRSFSVDDLLVLEIIRRCGTIAEELKPRLKQLHEMGIIEKISRGRGAKLILSERFYAELGQKGVYTRKRGLDRNARKALLLEHIRRNRRTGSPMSELMQVLPELTRNQIQGMLRELRKVNLIIPRGKKRAARWFPASGGN